MESICHKTKYIITQITRESLEGPALGRHGARSEGIPWRSVHPPHRQPQDRILLRLDLIEFRAFR